MTDEVTLDGKDYISSKRASELSSYTQDYIGQLARAGHIDARRLGGLWFIYMPSLEGYKERAETYKPQAPERTFVIDPDSLVSFDGKDYVSAARASEITGYHQDYVGQLARSGTVLSRQVGNRWYVEREGILAHEKEKDALLGAVQSQSVGIVRPDAERQGESTDFASETPDTDMKYTHDDKDLMPDLEKPEIQENQADIDDKTADEEVVEEYKVPIHIVRTPSRVQSYQAESRERAEKSSQNSQKTFVFYGAVAAGTFAVVVVLIGGYSLLKNHSVYAAGTQRNSLTANVASVGAAIGNALEAMLVHELVFKR